MLLTVPNDAFPPAPNAGRGARPEAARTGQGRGRLSESPSPRRRSVRSH